MLRSMYAAISGLKNHQTRMDVIGNNIANVNTVGYKSSRVTFEESLSQMLQGAVRPPATGGGTNPMQVGLGMNIGSIDTRLSQGNLEATGQFTDLAVEGKAYFAVADGNGTYYTRNGAFQFDANGFMVLPTNGMVLQGRMADSLGNIPSAAQPENIRIPFNDQSPARATTKINYSRNLDSDSLAVGTVAVSKRFMNNAENADTLTALYDSKGQSLGIKPDDVLTLSMTGPANTTVTQTFTVNATSSMGDLNTAIQTFLRGNGAGILTSVQTIDSVASATLRGGVQISGNQNAIQNLQITSNRPISSPAVTKAFSVPTTIPANSLPLAIVTDTFRAPANMGTSALNSDKLDDLYDEKGNSLGLEDGDVISFNGNIGTTPTNNVTPITYVSGANGTTLYDLLTKVKDNFKLPDTDGTVADNRSVSINAGGSDDNIPDGSIVIRGGPELAFALSNIQVRGTNTNNVAPTPNNFNSNMSMNEIQKARNTAVTETSITVFDDLGKEHIVLMRLTPTTVPNEWLWDAHLTGQEEIIQGNKGKLVFGQDGTVASFTSDDAQAQFVFDPKNGSPNVSVQLNVGDPGSFTGLTQFRSTTTAAAVGQDGFTMGRLRQVSIGEDGTITGAFTNGTNKTLAEILVVDFTNPGGLQKVKDSVYSTSPNSGDPIFGSPGTQSSSVIKPGALELSNVELAQEFTDMITTQRGFQANSRVITTSDSLLEELISLKR